MIVIFKHPHGGVWFGDVFHVYAAATGYITQTIPDLLDVEVHPRDGDRWVITPADGWTHDAIVEHIVGEICNASDYVDLRPLQEPRNEPTADAYDIPF